ncbi:DUF927 domain-containing protein [Natronosalvus amylolyticus]|uniref:phage NrS-1 polymerase family protein n=1 Tax=Natronosalvus amylolyticus TaxID=2961994 RepID=UPI0020C950AD|nr:DUF927 domain-containing protein [Natronosalvus amylolyticus]
MFAINNTKSDSLGVSARGESELVDSLKNYPSWVGFTSDKMPINPETGNAARINDSSTWSDYQTASGYCERTGDYLGFALDGSEDIVFIDLDGCRNPETGVVEDWAVDIIDRVDSYTELSKSGTGYHILARGDIALHAHKQKMEAEKVDVDKTSEIEVYVDGRFAIFTFDHIEPMSTDITTCDNLQAIYTDYYGEEQEPSEGDSFYDVEVSMTAEEILNKAKSSDEKFVKLWNGDKSMHSGDHSAADLALVSKLAFWTACDRDMMDSLFRKSDLMRGKWDEKRGDQTYGEMTIDKAVQSTTDVYQGHTGLPDDINLNVKDGCYGHLGTDEVGTPVFREVTNFTLARKEILREDGEQYVKLEVRPANGKNFEVTVKPEVFNDSRSFKDAVCTRLSTSFSGSSHDLPELRKVVLRQDSPERTSTTKIGLHDGEFVAPSTTFSPNDEHTHVYRDTGASVAEKIQIEDLDYNEDEVRDILELLPQIRDTKRWIPVIGYYYSALFAPLIRDIEGELPILSITGETGSGKSSSMRVVSRAFGSDGTAFAIDSTKFSLIKHLSAINNVPVWYDEYKPADIQSYKLDRFQALLRAATNGRTETRGQKSMGENLYRLTAPVAITGEQQIQGSAEQRRAIMTQFQRSTTDPGTPTQVAFTEIQQLNLNDHAKFSVEQVLQRIASDEDLDGIWEQCKDHVRGLADDDVGGLAINALAMVKLGMVVYGLLCDRVGATPAVDTDAIDDAITYVAGQKGVENRKTHVDELMEQVVRCIDNGDLTPLQSTTQRGDYTFVNLDDDGEELRLKFSRVYPAVSKYLKDHNLDIDLLGPDDYKDRFGDMESDETSYVVAASKQTRGLNRCVAVNARDIEDKLDIDLDDVRDDLHTS